MTTRYWLGIGIFLGLIIFLWKVPLNRDYLDAQAGRQLWVKVVSEVRNTLPEGEQIEIITQNNSPLNDMILLLSRETIGDTPGANNQLAITVLDSKFRKELRLLWQTKGGDTWYPRHVFMSSTPTVAWWSLLPATFVTVASLIFGQLLLALSLGILVGGTLLANGNPFVGVWEGFGRQTLLPILDGFHILLLLSALLIMGMAALVNRMGGMQGLVNIIARFGKTVRSSQIATIVFGLFLFFDDYTNCLTVGPTMRSLTDKMKISRAKLAFLVDSTAAPVAATALISTWIAYEVGLLQNLLGPLPVKISAYDLFVKSIPYRFYSLLLIPFLILIAVLGRDFGPMRRAELAARRGDLSGGGVPKKISIIFAVKSHVPSRWFNAVVPLFLLIFFIIFGFLYSGGGLGIFSGEIPFTGKSLAAILSSASTGRVLTLAALASLTGAVLLAVTQRLLNFNEIIQVLWGSLKFVSKALGIWILAWGVGHLCKDLQASHFLMALLGDIASPWIIPLLIFLIGAAMSFATGSSWGTMAILLPMALPLSFELGGLPLLVISVGAVLDGSIFGDHCSPIADTTILSSLSTECDHLTHVRTQFPYAVTVMIVAALCGYLLSPLGISPWVSIPLGILVLFGIIRFVGRQVDEPSLEPIIIPEMKEAGVPT